MPTFPWPSHRDAPMIGESSVAALLAGAELPAGSAPELRPLAEALAELRGQPVRDELKGEAETLAAFRREFGTAGPAHRLPPPGRALRRHLPGGAAAAAAAAILSLGGVAAAAYAGMLPTVAQRLAHDVIGAPGPGARPASGPSPAGSATTGHSGYGLCTAWARAKDHGTREQRAVAFARVAAAAGGADHVKAYCATAAHPGRSPSHRPHPSPAPHATGKPSGVPAPHATGKPSGVPAPHATGKPSGVPAPHATGKPSGVPAPHATRHPTGKPARQQ